jgi:hypothetical protein
VRLRDGGQTGTPTERLALASACRQACEGPGGGTSADSPVLPAPRLPSTCRESANTGSRYQHVVHIVTVERSQ